MALLLVSSRRASESLAAKVAISVHARGGSGGGIDSLWQNYFSRVDAFFFFFNGRVRLSCFMETVFHSLICLFFCAPVALVVVLRRLKGVSVVDGRAVFRPLVCSFFLSP